jgi:MYXO-CTERM domain-containing protein
MAHASRRQQEEPMRKPLILLLAAAGLALALLKRQRARELDEAIWEEPRDL